MTETNPYRERRRLELLDALEAAVRARDHYEREAQHQAALAQRYVEAYEGEGFKWPEE